MIKLTKSLVAVVPVYDSNTTPSGIIITDQEERVDQGIVKYVGAEVKDTNIGDYIVFSGYTGTLIFLEGEGRLIIFPEEFVVCKLDLDFENLEVDNIYFKGMHGDYFKVTYESIFNEISRQFTQEKGTVRIRERR